MRQFINLLVFLPAFVLTIPLASWAQSSPDKPNILLILVDDLNDYPAFLGGHPQAESPNMDRIARGGTVFENTYCSTPKSCPSRTSFMSGKDPDYTGVYNNEEVEKTFRNNFSSTGGNETVYTFPELLKDSAGYFTFGINKIFFGWKNEEFDNDYDTLTADPCARSGSWNRYAWVHNPDLGWPNEGIPGYIWHPAEDHAVEQTMFDWSAVDTALQFLDEYAADPSAYCDRPFMLTLGIFLPHKPLILPEYYFGTDYLDEFGIDPFEVPFNDPPGTSPPNGVIMPPQPDPAWSDFDGIPFLGQRIALGGNNHGEFIEFADTFPDPPGIRPGLSELERRAILAESKRANAVVAYLAALRFADRMVGRVLEALDTLPFRDNTIIVLASDHGYSLGEKKHWHKFGLWDTDTRVPLIVLDPRKPGGRRVSIQTSLLDLFPTLLELGGVEQMPKMPDGSPYQDGRSLVPLLGGEDASVTPGPALNSDRVVMTSLRRATGADSCYRQFSIRHPAFHYIRYTSPDPALPIFGCDSSTTTLGEELYHVGRNREFDPNEWHNLAADPAWADIVAWLGEFLPDSSLFDRTLPSLRIRPDSLPCLLGYIDTARFSVALFDSAGSELATAPAGSQLRWKLIGSDGSVWQIDSGSAFAVIPVDAVPAIDWAGADELLVQVALIDSNGVSLAMDRCSLAANPTLSPAAAFGVDVESNSATVNSLSWSNEAAIRQLTWDWGDGHRVEDPVPAPHSYAMPGTKTLTLTLQYGNATSCTTSSSSSFSIGSMDFNDGECMAPNNFHLLAASAQRAGLAWNPVWGAQLYQLRYRSLDAAHAQDSSWVQTWTTLPELALTALDEDRTWECQVRCLCDPSLGLTSLSDWSRVLHFHTGQCAYPRAVQADSTGPHDAWVSWIENPAASAGYEVLWGKPGTTPALSISSGNGIHLSGLDSAELYAFRVRSRCEQLYSTTPQTGGQSPAYNFTTMGGAPVRQIPTSTLNLQLQPNPSRGRFTVSVDLPEAESGTLRITNTLGVLWHAERIHGTGTAVQVAVNASKWPAGLYLVYVEHGGEKTSGRMVISR